MTTYAGMQGATVTSVNGAASATQILAQNPSRKSAVFVNDSAAIAYLKLEPLNATAASASSTSYTYKMLPGDTVELMTDPIVNSMVSAIWASATGAMRVTEM